MNIASIVIIAFVVLELANVIALYFFPSSKRFNAIGVFKAYDSAKMDEDVQKLVSYLINWIAGSKLIFIALLIAIVIRDDEIMLEYALLALILSIISFYWRLGPTARSIDKEGMMEPKGYSTILTVMITVFLLPMVVVLLLSPNFLGS